MPGRRMIPDEAVEAAFIAYKHATFHLSTGNALIAALEAAAPHMRQAFFLEMNLRAVQDELNTPLQLGRAIRGDD